MKFETTFLIEKCRKKAGEIKGGFETEKSCLIALKKNPSAYFGRPVSS